MATVEVADTGDDDDDGAVVTVPARGVVVLAVVALTLGITTGRVTATSVPELGTAPGDTTRRTCPTSIMLGFSMAFQRTMSRQFWPVSRPMRIMVSPGLTV